MIDASGAPARRIVATGGGTRVDAWVQAMADSTGLPVHVSGVAEGAALGAAFLGRMASGDETSMRDAARWARVARVVDPRTDWLAPTAERYARFCDSAGPRDHAG
jgi:xylulokinase